MDRLVEITLKKVHILSILDCYYKIFPLIYMSFDNEGIAVQGSCEERRSWLLRLSPEILLSIMNVESLQL